MDKILRGIEYFERSIFPSHRKLFERLALGQQPEALMITCSDSRVVPSLFTQTMPGELFVLRNAGNMLPASRDAGGGEWATVEYAIEVVKVAHVVVCGHSDCGAMKQLLKGRCPQSCPSVASWLANARPVKRAVARQARNMAPEEVLALAIRENVLLQLRRLGEHPRVARKVENRKLQLHAWIFDIGTGLTLSYNAETDRFVRLVPAAAARG